MKLNLARYPEMADHGSMVEKSKTLLKAERKTFEGRLSCIEGSQENPGGQTKGYVGGDQPS